MSQPSPLPANLDVKNLFTDLPSASPLEIVEILCRGEAGRVERILSCGQHSPEGFFYDQEEDEWVLVLQGKAVLEFADGTRIPLRPGDALLLPAHLRHRVAETSAEEVTIWLAVFFTRREAVPKAPPPQGEND